MSRRRRADKECSRFEIVPGQGSNGRGDRLSLSSADILAAIPKRNETGRRVDIGPPAWFDLPAKVALGSVIAPCSGAQTNIAQVRLFSLSLQCERGRGVDTIGFEWFLNMTTLVLGGFNGELSPNFLSGRDDVAFLILLPLE